MLKLMILLAVSMCLAYCSQHGILTVPITQKRKLDISLVVMVIMLSLVTGLRTQFNDTSLYIASYENSPTLDVFLNTSAKLFDNPLFYSLQCIFRHHISANANVFLLAIAFFTIGSFLRFFKKHSDNFSFSILLFFSLGLYVSTMAAMKQCLAMAILTYGIDYLIKGKRLLYFMFLFLAILFHSYAVLFIILPLFFHKPWTITTYVTIVATVFVLLTFESTITAFLDVAEEAGKEIDVTYVIGTQSINLFRLAVFAVPPLLSFIFQELLNDEYNKNKQLMLNMSLLSFLIMSLGAISAANLFGRSAIYFELGTIIILPWIIKNIFNEESQTMGHIIVGMCYLAFFAYSILGFSAEYRSISISQFLTSIF